MADDIGGVWRTIGGRRVFIKTGQSLSSAMKASGKFKNMFGYDESKDYMKDNEAIEVTSLLQMKYQVTKFIKQSIEKYGKKGLKEDDIKGYIHLTDIDDLGKEYTSVSVQYGKEINAYIDIYKDRVSYVELSEADKYYDMKEKKTIDLKK